MRKWLWCSMVLLNSEASLSVYSYIQPMHHQLPLSSLSLSLWARFALNDFSLGSWLNADKSRDLTLSNKRSIGFVLECQFSVRRLFRSSNVSGWTRIPSCHLNDITIATYVPTWIAYFIKFFRHTSPPFQFAGKIASQESYLMLTDEVCEEARAVSSPPPHQGDGKSSRCWKIQQKTPSWGNGECTGTALCVMHRKEEIPSLIPSGRLPFIK